MKQRVLGLKIFFVGLALVVFVRLAYWQVVKANELTAAAMSQRLATDIIPAPRGDILAADSFPLVTNAENYLLYADPKLNHDISAQQLNQLASALETTESGSLLASFNNPNLAWVKLADRVTPEMKEKISELNITGLGFEALPIRAYPDGSMSAQLLGFVGSDENGLPKGYFGLEGFYDKQLTGQPGKSTFESDALNRPIMMGEENEIPAQPGRTLKTSIDRTIQYLAASKLALGVNKYGAASGTVTVMDPVTGNILAMASWPSYDPSDFADYPDSVYKNPIVAESYEPGSTFKVIVMAAALDAKVVTPDTRCNECSGPVNVSGYAIRTWNDQYFPDSTMTEVIQHSDNTGMVFVSRRLGPDKMLDYLNKFGIGQLTGVDLQDESSPQLRPPNDWHEIDYATASFGQGIAVTPLQIVRAVGAIANEGKLMQPRLVTAIVDGKNQKTLPPSEGVQVVSPEAAAQMTQMMINSVDNGEAKWAKPRGYEFAGKTGTAQIPLAGHYEADKTIASFVGFAPANAPKFVMLVTLDQPQTSQWGSETAAPLWFDIAEGVLHYYQIPPSY